MTDRSSQRLLQGTLDVLILKTLSLGPHHGYGISSSVRARTEGEIAIEDAALYQALHRLEHQGAIESEWGVSENNRRAKYYQLTKTGRAKLHRESDRIRRYARAVFEILGARS